VLLLHFDGADGTQVFTDNSPAPLAAAGAAGTCLLSTAQSMFGGASLKCTSANRDYIYFVNAPALDIATQDFTVECWARLATVGSAQVLITEEINTGYYAFLLYINAAGKLVFACCSNSAIELTIIGTTTVVADVWYHIAGVRSGNTFTLWLDGASEGSAAYAGALITAQPLVIGCLGDHFTLPLNGYIDDVRITKGVARYTAPFARPTAAFPNS
jgi:hypothetical protein